MNLLNRAGLVEHGILYILRQNAKACVLSKQGLALMCATSESIAVVALPRKFHFAQKKQGDAYLYSSGTHQSPIRSAGYTNNTSMLVAQRCPHEEEITRSSRHADGHNYFPILTPSITTCHHSAMPVARAYGPDTQHMFSV